jgi:hypothetical protein
MSALGELFIYVIYAVLAMACIISLLLSFTSKKQTKPWAFIASLLFAFLFFGFRSCQKSNYKENQLSVVGTYYLTSYPSCDSCYLELKEDMTYLVMNKGKIVESSNWYYEVGGDFFITYLNNDKYQLGSGNYSYKDYTLKYRPKNILREYQADSNLRK